MHASKLFAVALLSTAAIYSESASAVLVNNVGLEVRARIDTDGPLPAPALVNLTESEIDLPYDRSIVSIAGAVPGSYAYSAVSDIGHQVLRVSGSLTNPTTTDMFGQGVALINVYAQAKDLLTLSSAVAGTFQITLELVVHGNLVTTPVEGQVIANSSLAFGPVAGLNTTDANIYKAAGAIDDTLSVSKSVTFATAGATVDMEFDTFISFTAFKIPAGFTASGDLSNTAFLNLVLPQQVTLAASGSGTFGVPIPVPEPQVYALMLVGLALIGAGARRRLVR